MALFALEVQGSRRMIDQTVVIEAETEDEAKQAFTDLDPYEVSVNTIYDGSTSETVFASDVRVAERLAEAASGEYQDETGDGTELTEFDIEIINIRELEEDTDEWSIDEYHAEGEASIRQFAEDRLD